MMKNRLLELEKQFQKSSNLNQRAVQAQALFGYTFGLEPKEYIWSLEPSNGTIGLWGLIRQKWNLETRNESNNRKATELFRMIKDVNIENGINLASSNWVLSAKDSIYFPIKRKSGKHPYKGITILGSTFIGDDIRTNQRFTLRREMKEEYLPELNRTLKNEPYGLRLLCTVMAIKEGFYKGSTSYKTNNPGNIGNTDSGLKREIATLKDGILAQKNYLEKVAAGNHSEYPIGKTKYIEPYYSDEIATNLRYGLSPHLPGYKFTYTGKLDQFVKIYATAARARNSYLSIIISYFKLNGINITPKSNLRDIINIQG